MPRAPLDELYFPWLYGLVADANEENPSRTYWRLFKLLYDKEFVWFVPNDDNRMEDGRALRGEFADREELERVDPSWYHLGCSMLEMLIALSRRLSFQTDREPHLWFWDLLKNIDLDGFNDRQRFSDQYVEDVLEQVIWRTYTHNGKGGLFPLEGPCDDQRHVEIWYQLSAYILERV